MPQHPDGACGARPDARTDAADDQPAGVWQQASGELTVKDSGGYLMMFTQGLPVQILVDNLKIERIAYIDLMNISDAIQAIFEY